ncbi:hypothetical protein PAPYR_9556 [Paratrimastix pyriformis]|uniref:Uncharacterized protein n=1 Tax=Paratrimastix pyriformis TaxID=342808 RepID=A0ABQ8UC59_9EUKA|nr:hypothetical protein PAPYR_9556 [Paratrimastix pyriformis]
MTRGMETHDRHVLSQAKPVRLDGPAPGSAIEARGAGAMVFAHPIEHALHPSPQRNIDNLGCCRPAGHTSSGGLAEEQPR